MDLKHPGVKALYFLVIGGLPFIISPIPYFFSILHGGLLWSLVIAFVFLPASTFFLISTSAYNGRKRWFRVLALTVVNVGVACLWLMYAIAWGSN